MLQRRLRIGYPRAARLMDELEELGVIGRPQKGGRTREVLIGKDDDPLNNREGDQDEEEHLD
jgi:S-DNA-T family DNA segregation ATPase FtsK/SpoIIIE